MSGAGGRAVGWRRGGGGALSTTLSIAPLQLNKWPADGATGSQPASQPPGQHLRVREVEGNHWQGRWQIFSGSSKTCSWRKCPAGPSWAKQGHKVQRFRPPQGNSSGDPHHPMSHPLSQAQGAEVKLQELDEKVRLGFRASEGRGS